VLVLGNIIVMGIEGLMVCIQVLRLEFYEMFGRFYESGGRRFNAAMIDYTKKIEQ
jgi:V/A-type H+-transporting ATPase subunit I